MSVVGTRTTADVLRQDGTWQRGVPSASLDPFETHVGQFFPGDRVVIAFAGADDDDDAAAPARSGVVRSLDYKARPRACRGSGRRAAARRSAARP